MSTVAALISPSTRLSLGQPCLGQTSPKSHPGEIGALVMLAHITKGNGEAMDKPTSYEIVIRGRATERSLGPLVDDFAIEATDTGTTRMTGAIRDAAHLHGVITHMTSLAIEIVSLARLEPGHLQPNNTPERQP